MIIQYDNMSPGVSKFAENREISNSNRHCRANFKGVKTFFFTF